MADFVQQDNKLFGAREMMIDRTVMPSLTCSGVLMRQPVDVCTIS